MHGSKAGLQLVLAANARLPSERAQALQVVQVAASFARAGVATCLYHARRENTLALPAGQDLFDYYAVAPGKRPSVEALGCLDWIDRVPRALQFWPARIQELSFARQAARRILEQHTQALVLTREIEIARLVVRGRAGAMQPPVFLELHRVPGGRARRRWLGEAALGLGGIVAISGGVRADLIEAGIAPDSIAVEHDGFEPARFAGLPSKHAARIALGLDPRLPLVAYTGSLLEWKGADVLVEAARALPQVRFVFAGGAPADVERLRALARGLDHVRIDGFQPPTRVATYLAAADVGVVPNRRQPAISSRYTSPLKVFEAFAAGLPLVASDLPALRELIDDENMGVLVAPEEPKALAQAIEQLCADPARRERIAARTRERVQTHTWDARARRLVAWMEGRKAGAGTIR